MMLSYVQSTLLILVSVAMALLLVAILNRVWPIENRKIINDVNAWQMGVLGTTYGVILGFMLFTVWSDFRMAEVDVALEAASLLNVHHIAAGLPEPQREAMAGLTLKYANAAVNEEWPEMQQQRESHAGGVTLEQMWQVLIAAQANSSTETTAVDHLTTALATLSERRRLRQDQYESQLPNGMESWLNTFRNGVLNRLNPSDRATALSRTIALLSPILRDADGNWTADYVRLRFHATKA
jgi:hypothetical protein